MTKGCPVTEAIEQIVSAWAFAHNIDGAARNDLFARLRAARIPDPEAAKLREALVLARTIVASDAAACAAFSAPDETSHPQCVLDVIDEALNPSPALVGDEDAAR